MSEIETKQMCPDCSNTEFSVYVYVEYDENGTLIESGLKFRCLRCGKRHLSLTDLVIL